MKRKAAILRLFGSKSGNVISYIYSASKCTSHGIICMEWLSLHAMASIQVLFHPATGAGAGAVTEDDASGGLPDLAGTHAILAG